MIDIQAISYETGLKERAEHLSHELNLPLNQEACPSLHVSKKYLALNYPNFSLLYVDFSSNTWKKRMREGLIMACKPKKGLKIIDVTAGWGRDAAMLSSYGAEVLMLERHPLMAALLDDALRRQTDEDKERLSLFLVKTDAITYLNHLEPNQYPDLIYVDPMHPQRTKSALVKKDLQILQQLIGEDKDALTLIQCAIQRVKQKVVVKWPQKLKPLIRPDCSVAGKTVRFDVYFAKPKLS